MSGQNCPDIFELADGNFAVIGTDDTKGLDAQLPADAPLSEDYRIVVVTRETLMHAKVDIPLGIDSSRMSSAAPRTARVEADSSRPVLTPEIKGGQQQVEIVRRLGKPPKERKTQSLDGTTCPEIFELSNGDFAIMGTEATEALDPKLPTDASRATYERIVIIPREIMIDAKADIPDA